MTDTLEQAFEAMRRMPPATRDSMAQAILTLANGSEPLDIEDEHLPALLDGLAQLERGEGVVGDPDELVAAAFERHRRT
ncbi:acetyltransferase [Methylobacterium aquaticum]|uniref:acetyltransferase n=1 Tax=Methylobacterium aquaticum TaxID=270351 RepID=UPI003D1755B4